MKFIEGLHLHKETLRQTGRKMRSSGAIKLPPRVENRSKFLPSSNQGSTPKCAAYTMAGVLEYWRWKLYGIAEQVDPDPIYAGAKERDGDPDGDGTTLEAVVEAAVALGYLSAPDMVVVEDWRDVKRALHRFDVMLWGMLIDDGWYDAQPNGWIPLGTKDIGGHATVGCGYADDYERYFDGQCSWGEIGWGWRGFYRMTMDQFKKQFMYGICINPDCVIDPAIEIMVKRK